MPIVDAHAYFGAPSESVRTGSLREIEQVFGSCGVAAAILAAAFAETGDFARGNEELAKALPRCTNLYGLVSVNPSYPEESAEEVRKRFADARFVGMKLPRWVAGPRIHSEGFKAILHAARRYGKPVVIDTLDSADVRDVIVLAEEYQTVRFVLAGMGGRDWETAIRACEPVLNTFLEIGSLEADRDKIRDAVAGVTPRRVLFGSHFPYLHPLYVLGMVQDAAIEKSDAQRIVFRNAVELFGLEQEGEAIRQRRAGEG